MAPPHSSKSGGFGNLSSPSLLSSLESTKQTSQAPASSIFSSPQTNSFGTSPSMPAFGTSYTAATACSNRRTPPEPAFGISPTSSSMPSSSPSLTFGFPSTGPGFTNTVNSFGGPPNVAKTPTWGSNSGASPFGSGFNSDSPSSPFLGPFGEKPTANFSFLPFPNMNNSGGASNPFGSSFVAFSLIGGAANFNRNTTPEPAGGISSTSSTLPLSSASPKLDFPSTGSGFANTRSPFGGDPNNFGNTFVRTSSIPAFVTSNTAVGFNRNTTPEPAGGISSTSFTFPLSSASPKLDFPSTGLGFANTKSPFGCDPSVPKTATWGSNSGASRSSPFGCIDFNRNLPASTSLGPFGQKPTANFSFLHTNNSENPFSASPFSSKSGQPPLSSQNGGSRITLYSASKMLDEDCTKVMSISAMQAYSVKSHEELRLEDYQQQGTKANPFSTSLSSNNEVSPPLASQNKGSGVAPYTLTKAVDEDSAKLISISAMPVYEVKSHEEWRWEDYQLRNEGGNGAAGALNWQTNPFIPSPSITETSESPPFSFKIPIDATSFYPFPHVPNANITTQTSERPLFSGKISNTTSFFGPLPFQASTETPLSSTTTNIISGESRIKESPTNSNPTWQPLTNTIAVPCTACGCIKTDAFPVQVQMTPESCQTKPADPTVAKPPTMADNIVPVKDPFGVQSSKSQIFADHATPATSIRIGISTMPVVDKPAPSSRISSVLTLRLVSQRQSTVHLKKGQPKSHVQKAPFFTQADPHGIPRPINHPIPRENPKSAFMMNIAEPADDNAEEDLLMVTSLELVPKLTRTDYYTEPLISELETKEILDPGFCKRVRGFVIGRHGYGKVEFEGETDVRGLDLDSLVEFNAKEVVVYKDESKKVGVGKGLNKPALVTLMNVKCVDKKTGAAFVDGDQVAKYERMLRKMAQKQGAEFVSYDPVKGEWKFHVHHF